ncbi:uncharacterized protein LOC124256353 isoform X3 [Haliotis rubra]|uniref:uncharacterized protein LOC124256353 isoform X3 n=1 Tax=Haliotis rubra TaxID=36100 RepID=UPI001EE5EE99|nr:uncharacterized protein LOC124256353 isoform X3 [Haliotis rubra]
MDEHLDIPGSMSDSGESDDSSISSRYSSEGEVPLPTYDDLSDPDDPAPGFKTSGDIHLSSIVSKTEQKQILGILSGDSKQPFFGIFPINIEPTLNAEYAHIVQRLRDLPDRDCTVIIAGGSLLKMMDPTWEGRVPASVLCDACVFSPTQTVMVLTFTAGGGDSHKNIQYNTKFASFFISHVKDDTKFDFSVVHVTIDNLSWQEKHSFLTRINQAVNSTKRIRFPTELHMDKGKCTAIMKSLLKHLSKDPESERPSPSLENTAHATAIPKQGASDKFQQQIRTKDADHESVYARHEVRTALLKYLSAQQERLENESSPQFPNISQDKPSELQLLEADARTSSTRYTFPTCSVCELQFTLKGPAPYLLPCLHAVCETCVTSAACGVICSTCQREVNLTDTSLQKDTVRQKEIFHLTVKHCPTELICTHEDDGNQAVCWCRDCEELLCEYCQNMHNSLKLSKKHVLQNFSDMVPTVSDIPTSCSIHKYNALDLFDKSCQKLICARCRLSDHAHHDVDELDVVADAVTKQLRRYKNVLSTLQDRQQLYIQSVKQGRESTHRTHNTWKETIHHTFQILRLQLDQSEKEFLIDLESQTKEANAIQHDLLTTYEDDMKTCTGVVDYIDKVLLYGSKLDLLDVESSVRDMTQACQDTATPETHIPPAVCNSNALSKLRSITSGFGPLLTRQSVKDADTQTDDDFMADMEMKHKMVIAELKTKNDSDEKRIKRLTDESNAEIRSLKSRIEEKEVIEKRAPTTMDFLLGVARECVVHELKPGAIDRSMFLKCTPLKYDKDRVNLDTVHINTEGDLVNRKSDTRPAGEGRLKKYWGTCSTDPLPQDGCPQYWEVENRVSLDKPLSGTNLILEVGVCREEQRDVSHCIDGRPYSYCMDVAHCTTHGGICRKIWKEGKYVLCLPDTLPNTAGASHTLHYGVVYDDARKKIVFIDVKEKKVMSTLDNVDCSEPLWPMFGVYNPHLLTVSMRLVVGSDINMTEEKKAMIVKALS